VREMCPDVAIWHDIECGGYRADLGLWRRMAAEARGPVLDVGAGTGRVALDLAAHGHDVVALDIDARLLDVLAERAVAQGLRIATVAGDATAFELARRDFALIVVPMQTIQLLSGMEARARFLGAARRHLRPGGRLAIALAQDIAPFCPAEGDLLPEPDIGECGGRLHVSQPVAVRRTPHGMTLERRRETTASDGARSEDMDLITLVALDATGLAAEGVAAGFDVEPAQVIPETDRHVGSRVVVLRG
jgi:SAM-dependent methyltransferase